MQVLTLSDLSSALVGAGHAYIHSNTHLGKVAAYNLVSSIAGRWVSSYLSGGVFDKFTLGFVSGDSKNYLVVFLTRFVIAKLMHEGHAGPKSWDTVLTDAFSSNLITMLGMSDYNILGSLGGYTAATGPVN